MIKYCDKYSNVIVNYVSSFQNTPYGLQKIKRVFLNIKNKIAYDSEAEIQNASETLVMGYGNNLDKNILLYTTLDSMGFKCKLVEARVKGELPPFNENNKEFLWFYVVVEFLDVTICLDCSFDKFYMKAWNIVNKNNDVGYAIEDYYIEDKKPFKITEKKVVIGYENCREEVKGNLVMAHGF